MPFWVGLENIQSGNLIQMCVDFIINFIESYDSCLSSYGIQEFCLVQLCKVILV